jgi:hypothetical protein
MKIEGNEYVDQEAKRAATDSTILRCFTTV